MPKLIVLATTCLHSSLARNTSADETLETGPAMVHINRDTGRKVYRLSASPLRQTGFPGRFDDQTSV
jgi:hypothetical protein